MKKVLYLAILFFAVSCTDYLSKPMFDRINADEFFTGETDLELYANGLLNGYTPSYSSIGIGDDAYTDLGASKTSKDYFRPGVWNASQASGWSNSDWLGIRRANYMIENMVRCQDEVSEDVYNHYMGVARFWRAWLYLIKVITFGDVPWIDHVVATDDEILYASQDDREYVMSKVLEDINYACDNCLTTSEYVNDSRTIINRWVALAFKTRLCLFEGTFRKYHTTNPSTGVAWNNQYETATDFLREAVDAAEILMEEGPFGLYSTSKPAEDYRALFTTETPNTTEFIWCRQYSSTLPLYHALTFYFSSTTGSQNYSPTKEFMMMFLKQDGTPVDSEVFYPVGNDYPSSPYYTNPEDEFVDEDGEFYRDYRLSQIVNPPGHTYITTANVEANKAPDMTFSRTGYAFIKWNIEEAINFSSTRDYSSLPILRYGEVLLNYAEAKAELGEMSEDIWNQTVGALRERAGVTSIYPESGDYVEDQFLINHFAQATAGQGLSNIILEIRRERATELFMEYGTRYKDLFRWRCGELIVQRGTEGKGWRGIYVTQDMYQNGFTFNGETYTFNIGDDGTRVIGMSTSETDLNKTLTSGTYGFLIYNYELEWDDKMYVQPIPTSALTLNPNLYQNPGW